MWTPARSPAAGMSGVVITLGVESRAVCGAMVPDGAVRGYRPVASGHVRCRGERRGWWGSRRGPGDGPCAPAGDLSPTRHMAIHHDRMVVGPVRIGAPASRTRLNDSRRMHGAGRSPAMGHQWRREETYGRPDRRHSGSAASAASARGPKHSRGTRSVQEDRGLSGFVGHAAPSLASLGDVEHVISRAPRRPSDWSKGQSSSSCMG